MKIVISEDQYNHILGQDNIKSKPSDKEYKESLFKAIKSIYGNQESYWEDKGRGPGGRGGVVNVFTLQTLLQNNGMEEFITPEHNWSIINYFDTNPKVREFIINLYLDDDSQISFSEWLDLNKRKLFLSTSNDGYLNKLITINSKSLLKGIRNEYEANKYLNNFKSPKFRMVKANIPGSPKDREGVDFYLVNEKGNKYSIQTKPLTFYEKRCDENGQTCEHIIKSYNVGNLPKYNVDYFMFVSSNSKHAVLVRNNKTNKDQITVQKSKEHYGYYDMIIFPESFEVKLLRV